MALSEKEWFIEAPWGKLCVVAWGNCLDPPVLVCHGALDSAASFRPLIRLLPEKFYYIGMEFPGFGKSDSMPPGLMISTHDLMYALHLVVKHFRWKNFILLGHSMGCHLGRMYTVTYPEKVTRMVQLDPIANRLTVPVEKFGQWYKQLYTDYFDNYQTYNSPKENSPKYKKIEAIEKIMKSRGLNKEAAEATLERWSEPTGDGHIRFTYDQRNKIISNVPYSEKQVKSVYTRMATPTLTLIAGDSKQNGSYKGYEYLLDESSFPANNYRVRIVPGNHDVHIIHPDRVATYVAQFLLHGIKGLDSKSNL